MFAPEDSPARATGLMGWVPAARMHVDHGVGNEPLGVDQIGGLQTRKAFVCLSFANLFFDFALGTVNIYQYPLVSYTPPVEGTYLPR